MHEAKIEDTEAGRLPADDGWFMPPSEPARSPWPLTAPA
jgi:hypothetical protein